MISKKQILEVLNYIKNKCNENPCSDCPFHYDDGCNIQQPPQEWNLKENEKEEKWTPFKD